MCVAQPIERWKFYFRNINSGETTTTLIERNLMSVSEHDNPTDLEAAAKLKAGLGPAWQCVNKHRARRKRK